MSARPEDRRPIFEEAIGLMVCKKRKQEIENKLGESNSDLFIYRQRIDEAERRLGPMAKQAEAAREYNEYSESLKINEANTYIFRYENAEGGEGKVQKGHRVHLRPDHLPQHAGGENQPARRRTTAPRSLRRTRSSPSSTTAAWNSPWATSARTANSNSCASGSAPTVPRSPKRRTCSNRAECASARSTTRRRRAPSAARREPPASRRSKTKRTCCVRRFPRSTTRSRCSSG